MYILFFIFALGVVVALPLYFLSVEHVKLQERYGKQKGTKIGERFGRISADLLFFSLIGIWFSPQPGFIVPVFQNLFVRVPVINFPIPLFHLIIFVSFVLPGVWFLIQSVKGLSRKVSETHRAEKVVSTGIYATVRHPHTGWFLVHLGFCFLLSGWYALLSTPFIFILLYLISRKEEEAELTKDFGEEYEKYKKKVPMFVPRLGK